MGDPLGGERGRVIQADNLTVLRALPDACLDLVYLDPPFNTGKAQVQRRLRTVQDPADCHSYRRPGAAGVRFRPC